MTSVTSPQQTDRRGTDEIPGPRGGQGVRLLVLGADPDAQELRDQAAAAGYELAQRYSARVSHVAYGTGIDPGDARYTKIRDAGLALLPLQKCAEELGLSADAAETGTPTHVAEATEASEAVEDVEAVEAAEASDAADAADVEVATEADFGIEPELGARDAPVNAPLEIPPLHTAEADESADEAAEIDFVPGISDEATGLPLAAAVIGVDPWLGAAVEAAAEAEAGVEAEAGAEAEVAEAEAPRPAPAPAPAPVHYTAGHVLLSILWALIPFATFGLLTPVAFGYAAYRMRSRALVLTAVGYTIAVLASFVLSAARPHAATPADAAGALLTLCLAGTWLGGTLHAVSIRTRVFAR